jgi:hypothetical protein
MLLGIGLHAALSFAPLPWIVHDSRQNGVFGLFFAAVHGFRMPLFFLLSGFFTAMLWRKRGLKALLQHRFKRVVLPMLLGLVTIVPLMFVVSGIAIYSGSKRNAVVAAQNGTPARADLWTAAAQGSVETVREHLANGADVNARNKDGATPIHGASAFGKTEVVSLLLEQGANPNLADQRGSTPLHGAAFFGKTETVEVLLEGGARVDLADASGQTPLDVLNADWATTKLIASLIGMEIERREVLAGREAVAGLIRGRLAEPDPIIEPQARTERIEVAEGRKAPPWSPGKNQAGGLVGLLMVIPVFHHLWFLWFLCWLVAGFAVCVQVAGWLRLKALPRWLVVSPARFLWLVPLTMVPQWFMGDQGQGFGPDLSIGLLPIPQVLGYYAVFFAFGAFYHEAADDGGRLGKLWWMTLPVALLVVFPFGLGFSSGWMAKANTLVAVEWHRPISVVLQVAYAWMMSFALMGLVRRALASENKTVRYLSDSAYWLYLAHLPLVIACQLLVRDWPVPALAKFFVVCLTVTGVLLLSYQFLVRCSWIGRLLNGPRFAPGSPTASARTGGPLPPPLPSLPSLPAEGMVNADPETGSPVK